MKNFFFHIVKRHILPIILVTCLFLSILSLIDSCEITAKAVAQKTISNAIPIKQNSTYQSSFLSKETHYYCFYSGTKKENSSICIEFSKIPSLSFQLYDSTGNPVSPLNYQFRSSKKYLKLQYMFSPNSSFLLALESHSNTRLPYTITYTTRQKKKKQKTNSKKKVTPSKQTTTPSTNTNQTISKQPTSKKITSKQTTSKKTISKKITSRQTTSKINTSKKISSKNEKKEIPIKKVSLSSSFLPVKKGVETNLSANLSPENSSGKYEWSISNPSILQINSKRKNSISFLGKKEGTAIITYRFIGRKTFSASCTIRIN